MKVTFDFIHPPWQGSVLPMIVIMPEPSKAAIEIRAAGLIVMTQIMCFHDLAQRQHAGQKVNLATNKFNTP